MSKKCHRCGSDLKDKDVCLHCAIINTPIFRLLAKVRRGEQLELSEFLQFMGLVTYSVATRREMKDDIPILQASNLGSIEDIIKAAEDIVKGKIEGSGA